MTAKKGFLSRKGGVAMVTGIRICTICLSALQNDLNFEGESFTKFKMGNTQTETWNEIFVKSFLYLYHVIISRTR